MKTILTSLVFSALLCGYAGALGIEWGVDQLYLPGDSEAVLASSDTYGSDVGDYVLKLVWVNDGSMTDGKYDDFEVVDTGTLMTTPVEQAGVVTGSADVDTAGTYVMLLYNNNGGYYGLTANDTAISTFTVSQTALNEEIGFNDYTVTGQGVYSGTLVPEPGTTALALAGVALLFRRRKA